MRLLYILLLTALLSGLASAMPAADPERPLYQCLVPGLPLTGGKRAGGLWGPVEWPTPPSLTPAQIAAQQAADLARIETVARGRLMSRGLWLVSFGVGLLVAGAVAHVLCRSGVGQRVIEWGLAAGAACLTAGLLHWWVYESYRWLMAGITVIVLLGLFAGLYRLRSWGIFGGRTNGIVAH
jgi:hypothetical protein